MAPSTVDPDPSFIVVSFLKFQSDAIRPECGADRFARERNIPARLYDAGVTAQGQPYLVLEYVESETITVYCERLRLDIRARQTLFLEVLSAVQYGHTNLVVHRDLKLVSA